MSDPALDSSAAGLRGINAYWHALDAEGIRGGEHRALIGGLWDEVGLLQFEFFKQTGLEPRYRLLDVGCSLLRGALHFAGCRDARNYCGIDANAPLIEGSYPNRASARWQHGSPLRLDRTCRG